MEITHFVLNSHSVGGVGYPIAGAPSLDDLATEFYGKKYVSQQVGDGRERDMFDNDSVYEFDMSEDDPDEHFWQMESPDEWANQTYLGWDRASKDTKYHKGHNREEYWKSLSYSDNEDEVTHPGNPAEGEDVYGAVFRYDFQVYREAPQVPWTLARLIRAGILPYGKYLLYVSW